MKLPKLSLAVLLVATIVSMGAGLFTCADVFAEGRTVDSPMPSFECRCETKHCVLRWTNSSRHAEDNISDPQIVKDTGTYLETAWAKYTELFGRQPYLAPGLTKMEIVFRDMDCYGVSDPPNGPIQFNSSDWVKNPGIRKPTSAHELFHKMQYAYGYRTKWKPREPYSWFTEGTAVWAEVFVWGMVSRNAKADTIFRDTRMDLYDADYAAMPFWIYCVKGNHPNANNKFMVKLFEKCELNGGDQNRALNETIKETYGGSPGDFLNSFARDRRHGFWSDTCDSPYGCILGPEGKDLVKEVRDLQKKPY